jgi:hypothetical protein
VHIAISVVVLKHSPTKEDTIKGAAPTRALLSQTSTLFQHATKIKAAFRLARVFVPLETPHRGVSTLRRL